MKVFLLEKHYFRLGSTIFKQIICIPMVSVDQFSQISLSSKIRINASKKIKKTDLPKPNRFFSVYEFIEGITAFNDKGEFGKSFK